MQRGLLELDADVLADGHGVRLRVAPEEAHRAAVRAAQAGDALDRGGLARAVGAEDAEDLAAGDLEADVGDRGAGGARGRRRDRTCAGG
nr:hypothetical protein GCM10025730_35820 [Promicromonospora thailandica]